MVKNKNHIFCFYVYRPWYTPLRASAYALFKIAPGDFVDSERVMDNLFRVSLNL